MLTQLQVKKFEFKLHIYLWVQIELSGQVQLCHLSFYFLLLLRQYYMCILKNKTILLFLLKEEKGLSLLILLGAHKFSHPISHYIATSPWLGPSQHKSISWIKLSPTLVLCFWDLNQIRKALSIHLLIRTKSFGCWVLEKWKHCIYSWLDNRISYFNDKLE